jgi:hypothetical protein
LPHELLVTKLLSHFLCGDFNAFADFRRTLPGLYRPASAPRSSRDSVGLSERSPKNYASGMKSNTITDNLSGVRSNTITDNPSGMRSNTIKDNLSMMRSNRSMDSLSERGTQIEAVFGVRVKIFGVRSEPVVWDFFSFDTVRTVQKAVRDRLNIHR